MHAPQHHFPQNHKCFSGMRGDSRLRQPEDRGGARCAAVDNAALAAVGALGWRRGVAHHRATTRRGGWHVCLVFLASHICRLARDVCVFFNNQERVRAASRVRALVCRGCPAGTHWGDDPSSQDDGSSQRQLVRARCASLLVVCLCVALRTRVRLSGIGIGSSCFPDKLEVLRQTCYKTSFFREEDNSKTPTVGSVWPDFSTCQQMLKTLPRNRTLLGFF